MRSVRNTVGISGPRHRAGRTHPRAELRRCRGWAYAMEMDSCTIAIVSGGGGRIQPQSFPVQDHAGSRPGPQERRRAGAGRRLPRAAVLTRRSPPQLRRNRPGARTCLHGPCEPLCFSYRGQEQRSLAGVRRTTCSTSPLRTYATSGSCGRFEPNVALSLTNAALTVFLARPTTRAICEIDMPSDRRKPVLQSNTRFLPCSVQARVSEKLVNFQLPRADQYSVAVDKNCRSQRGWSRSTLGSPLRGGPSRAPIGLRPQRVTVRTRMVINQVPASSPAASPLPESLVTGAPGRGFVYTAPGRVRYCGADHPESGPGACRRGQYAAFGGPRMAPGPILRRREQR